MYWRNTRGAEIRKDKRNGNQELGWTEKEKKGKKTQRKKMEKTEAEKLQEREDIVIKWYDRTIVSLFMQTTPTYCANQMLAEAIQT